MGKPDFSYLVLTLNGSTIGYGSFLTAVIDFLIQASGSTSCLCCQSIIY
jgi:large-conductance mechanosensitive channel